MPQLFAHPDSESAPRRRALGIRVLGVVLVFLGLALFAALASYDWRDVSAQCAPAQSPPGNLVGYGGAWFAYIATLLLGLAAWTLPLWVVLSGILLALGRRIGWRLAGMLLVTFAAIGLSAQLGAAAPSVAALYGPDHLNACSRAGGVFGEKFRSPAEIAGGAILILIGFKILLEHIL